MTSLETCSALQEELGAARPWPGGRVHTITPFCICMIYSKKPLCSILTVGCICYTAIFAPYAEQTPSGLRKGYRTAMSFVCIHVYPQKNMIWHTKTVTNLF